MRSKAEFYEHLYSSLASLLEGQRNWVTNLSNASSLLYASLNRYQQRVAGGSEAKVINWAGFYLLSPFFPQSDASTASAPKPLKRPTLWLGPFCGLPACQQIISVPGKGVCADASALLPPRAVRVDDTEAYREYPNCLQTSCH